MDARRLTRGGPARPATAPGPTPPDSVAVRRRSGRTFLPAYAVTVWADGRVLYQGEAWTVAVGERRGQIEPERARALLDAFDGAGFAALAERQSRDGPAFAFDAPWTDVTLARGGRAWGFTACVDSGHGEREAWALAAAVERAAGIDAWVGTQEERDAVVAARRAAR